MPDYPPCAVCGKELVYVTGQPPYEVYLCPDLELHQLDDRARDEERRFEEWQRRRAKESEQHYWNVAADHRHMSDWSLETYPDDIRGQAAKHKAEAWLDDSDTYSENNVYIYGGVGTGKSGLAWSIMRHRILIDYSNADFVNVRAWLGDIKAAISDGESKLAQSIAARPEQLDLLIFDDLGAERPSDFAIETIATVVEHRHRQNLSTVVTSNYSPSQLIKRLGHGDPVVGQRIVSRLTENCLQIRVDGADRRLNKAAA